jgi:hypothetical protein
MVEREKAFACAAASWSAVLLHRFGSAVTFASQAIAFCSVTQAVA